MVATTGYFKAGYPTKLADSIGSMMANSQQFGCSFILAVRAQPDIGYSLLGSLSQFFCKMTFYIHIGM